MGRKERIMKKFNVNVCKEVKNEIEQCPFCSGKSIIRISSYNANKSSMKWYFNIECDKCKVVQPKLYEIEVMFCQSGEIKLLKDERKKAIDDWNTRSC